jgi:acetyl-CoA carboxylase carboxyl transferase subunit alpha
VREPLGGAHRNKEQACSSLKQAITRALDELTGVPTDVLLEKRYQKARKIGFHLF